MLINVMVGEKKDNGKYKVKKVTCISNGRKYKSSTKGKTVTLKVGKKAVNTVDTVFAIQYQ